MTNKTGSKVTMVVNQVNPLYSQFVIPADETNRAKAHFIDKQLTNLLLTESIPLTFSYVPEASSNYLINTVQSTADRIMSSFITSDSRVDGSKDALDKILQTLAVLKDENTYPNQELATHVAIALDTFLTEQFNLLLKFVIGSTATISSFAEDYEEICNGLLTKPYYNRMWEPMLRLITIAAYTIEQIGLDIHINTPEQVDHSGTNKSRVYGKLHVGAPMIYKPGFDFKAIVELPGTHTIEPHHKLYNILSSIVSDTGQLYLKVHVGNPYRTDGCITVYFNVHSNTITMMV